MWVDHPVRFKALSRGQLVGCCVHPGEEILYQIHLFDTDILAVDSCSSSTNLLTDFQLCQFCSDSFYFIFETLFYHFLHHGDRTISWLEDPQVLCCQHRPVSIVFCRGIRISLIIDLRTLPTWTLTSEFLLEIRASLLPSMEINQHAKWRFEFEWNH